MHHKSSEICEHVETLNQKEHYPFGEQLTSEPMQLITIVIYINKITVYSLLFHVHVYVTGYL